MRKNVQGDKLIRHKVTIVGAGSVGVACAQHIAENAYANIVLVDAIDGIPQGRALDLLQCGPILGFGSKIVGSTSYEETEGSDIAVIAAGAGRKPNMSREDLLIANANVIREVTENIVKWSPNCIIVMVTNPLDAMVWLALQVSKFPRHRVIGQSGILDSARLATFISMELNVPVTSVSTCILGAHGDSMVPVLKLCTVSGSPITDLLPPDKIHTVMQRTLHGGEEIVSLLKTSAANAPGAAVSRMVDSILLDRRDILPCAAYLEGEYGIVDTVVGVPVRLGKKGIEEVVQIDLAPEENNALKQSAATVKCMIERMKSEDK